MSDKALDGAAYFDDGAPHTEAVKAAVVQGPGALVESLERQNEALRHTLAREAMRRESYRTTLEAMYREARSGDPIPEAMMQAVREVLEWGT